MAIHNADTIHTTLQKVPQNEAGLALLARHRLNQKVTAIALAACGIAEGTSITDVSVEEIHEYISMRALVRTALLKYESEV